MPLAHPPERFRAVPHLCTLPAGTRLWRVHPKGVEPTAFASWSVDPNFGGGRFDATERDPYPFYYAALDADTALAETFLRDLPFNASGYRVIRRRRVRDRRASVVETTGELTLVDLCSGEALAAVAQDTWLIHAEAADYHATRRWASWIRAQAPAAHGLIWPSKREGAKRSLVLFGDAGRCPPGALAADPSAGLDLDDLAGAVWLNERLARYRARIAEPRSAPQPA